MKQAHRRESPWQRSQRNCQALCGPEEKPQVKVCSERAAHHMKRGKTYVKAVKLVYDGGFCCKKREKRLTGIAIKASEPFHLEELIGLRGAR
jgi:hypothetical protein